jgi:hypothetical protein
MACDQVVSRLIMSAIVTLIGVGWIWLARRIS